MLVVTTSRKKKTVDTANRNGNPYKENPLEKPKLQATIQNLHATIGKLPKNLIKTNKSHLTFLRKTIKQTANGTGDNANPPGENNIARYKIKILRRMTMNSPQTKSDLITTNERLETLLRNAIMLLTENGYQDWEIEDELGLDEDECKKYLSESDEDHDDDDDDDDWIGLTD